MARRHAGEQGPRHCLDGEESVAQTLAPRLFTTGAAPRMVAVIGEVTDGDDTVDFSPAQHLPLLDQQVAVVGEAVLLIVDPIIRVVEGAKDTYNPSAVREKLAPIVGLAQAHRLAIVGVTHFNKLQSSPMSGRADRVLGSGAWVRWRVWYSGSTGWTMTTLTGKQARHDALEEQLGAPRERAILQDPRGGVAGPRRHRRACRVDGVR